MHKPLNKLFTQDIGLIHFIGIGGIGMSGMAEILHGLGYSIQGSDISSSYVTERLSKIGIKVFPQHEENNVLGAKLIVKSTVVKDDNPEIQKGKQLGIPIIKRSDMLAEILRSKHAISVTGTHGKTTTTSLLAAVFNGANLGPTVINGGVINQFDTNAFIGNGDYILAEADESDGTFIRIPSYIGVITNIDPEHLDYYKDFDNVKIAYKIFIDGLPFYGFAMLCYDHPNVRELGDKVKERRIIKYGIEHDDLDIKAINIRHDKDGMLFDLSFSEAFANKNNIANLISDVKLGIYGKHNVLNSLAAIAIGIEKGISIESIKSSLAAFQGVKRRFTKTGEVKGVTIIDDYAHHPEEIKVTLKTARMVANMNGGKVIAVMQPHRYTRLRDLMDEFAKSFDNADELIISEVYAAGEEPIANISGAKLIEEIKKYRESSAIMLEDPKDLPNLINKLAMPSDFVVLLGAGSITKWSYELPEQLNKICN